MYSAVLAFRGARAGQLTLAAGVPTAGTPLLARRRDWCFSTGAFHQVVPWLSWGSVPNSEGVRPVLRGFWADYSCDCFRAVQKWNIVVQKWPWDGTNFVPNWGSSPLEVRQSFLNRKHTSINTSTKNAQQHSRTAT